MHRVGANVFHSSGFVGKVATTHKSGVVERNGNFITAAVEELQDGEKFVDGSEQTSYMVTRRADGMDVWVTDQDIEAL